MHLKNVNFLHPVKRSYLLVNVHIFNAFPLIRQGRTDPIKSIPSLLAIKKADLSGSAFYKNVFRVTLFVVKSAYQQSNFIVQNFDKSV